MGVDVNLAEVGEGLETGARGAAAPIKDVVLAFVVERDFAGDFDHG